MNSRSSPGVRSLVCLGVLASAGFTAASSGGAERVSTPGSVIQVNERDFSIAAAQHRVSPGVVVLQVSNHGPDMHELIVVRTRSAHLGLRSDGLTVNEEALQRVKAGGLEPGQPGSLRELRLQLRPGRYELFCNMSGHYLGGMHTVIVVR